MKNLLGNYDSAEAGYKPAQKANLWPDLYFLALFKYPLSMNISKYRPKNSKCGRVKPRSFVP
jgi:hypothetical protein